MPSHTPTTIGYITPQVYTSYYRLLLAGVQQAALARGARLLVFQMPASEVAASRVGWDRVDGWVACFGDIYTAGLDAIARSGRPLSMISLPVPGAAAVTVTDNIGGMRSVVRHLLDLGHRRIGFVAWDGNPDMPDRIAGYRQAHAELGLTPDPALMYRAARGWQSDGAGAAERMLADGITCDAIAFSNDYLALGAMQAFQRAGVRIPEDLAITGFDDAPEAQIATPALTTVRMRFQAMSRAATERLIDIVGGAAPASEPIVVPTSLVVRRSAGERRLLAAPSAGSVEYAALARRLAETVAAPERLGPGDAPSRLWAGVDTVVRAVAAAYGEAEMPEDAELQHAWTSAIAASSYADQLDEAVDEIEALLDARTATDAEDGRFAGVIHQLHTTLLRASVGGQIERINRSEDALLFSDTVARTLAESDLAALYSLGWIGGSGAAAAVIGLWRDAARGPLHIAGCFPKDSALASELADAAAFPPAGLTGLSDRDPLTIVPLRSVRREWGFLAMGFPTSLETSAFDTARLVAALVSARIDAETLQQERAAQEAELRIAYERERALTETVRELGCPVIPLNATTLLVPLIGVIDSRRAEQIITELLRATEANRAAMVLIDVTGVPLIDTHVAGLLIRLAHMLRLLGAQAALVGVRPEIAQSIVALGVDLRDIRSYASLMAALASHRREG